MKPIRVFFSPLSYRFYASRAYKEIKPGIIEITGERFDVTDQIGEIVRRYNLEFTEVKEPAAQGLSAEQRPGFARADNGDPDTIVPAPAPHKKRPEEPQ